MSEQTTSAKPISCEQCRELLSDYVDRELSAEERASVENHVATCVRCTSESTRLVGLKKIVQHWDGVKGSGEFRKSVMERMIRESQQVPSSQFTEAAAKAAESQRQEAARDEEESRGLPPIWILLVAAVVAAIAYFVVLKLRGF